MKGLEKSAYNILLYNSAIKKIQAFNTQKSQNSLSATLCAKLAKHKAEWLSHTECTLKTLQLLVYRIKILFSQINPV